LNVFEKRAQELQRYKRTDGTIISDTREREALNNIITQNMCIVLKKLRETFGIRADQAWNLLKHNKVKRYVFKPSGKTVWTVTGETDEHLIYEVVGYCHCEDFFFKFDTGYICQHIIAQKLAERKGRFERIEMKDEDYGKFMSKWKPSQ